MGLWYALFRTEPIYTEPEPISRHGSGIAMIVDAAIRPDKRYIDLLELSLSAFRIIRKMFVVMTYLNTRKRESTTADDAPKRSGVGWKPVKMITKM